MRSILYASLVCLGSVSIIFAGDTPGEDAVREAIKSLKEKRALVKDKADQALIDAAISDLQERLAQVGKEMKNDEKKEVKGVEPFLMPRNWELKFNTGKIRPVYKAKTGELKLVYDFSNAKQLNDFEYDKDFKPTSQKGILTVNGGERIKHIVRYSTASVSCEASVEVNGNLLIWDDRLILFAGHRNNAQAHDFDLWYSGKVIAGRGNTPFSMIKNNVVVKNFQITNRKASVNVNGITALAEIEGGQAGQLILGANDAPNRYRRLEIVGLIDPEWAAEFFAEKK